MSFTLSSITPRVRSRLNDAVGSVYTDAVLLPFAQDACDELQLRLELNGILALEKKTSSPITVAIGQTTFTYGGSPALPADLLDPQRMDERLAGSSDLYVDMIRREWEPVILPTDSLRYWTWRDQTIFTVGATNAREVRIYYLARLLNITTINDLITINNSQMYLICKIAALASRFIGSNPTRGDQLDNEAEMALAQLIGIGAKSRQGTRTRRRPFVLVGRRRWI